MILLDHRIHQQLATRRLRVVEYELQHGTDEYPFLIDSRGIVVVPVTSLKLNQPAPNRFVSSGVPQLDAMSAGKAISRQHRAGLRQRRHRQDQPRGRLSTAPAVAEAEPSTSPLKSPCSRSYAA